MKKRQKIMHLTTAHQPYDTRIFHKEVSTLAKYFDTALLVPIASQSESGKASTRNISIVWLPASKSRLHRMTTLSTLALLRALAHKADVYHVHDPELLWVGLLLRFFGKKVVYDVHEDLPRQILSKHWIPPFLRGVVSKIAAFAEWFAGKFMSGIVAATPAIAKRFPPHKTVVVQNFPLLSEFEDADGIPYQERPMQIAYIGGITSIRGAEEMVRAMEYLPERLHARLVMAGAFSPPELEGEIRKLPGWRYVKFLGWQDRRSVAKLLGRSRVGLVLFHPEPNHVEAQPNKLFEYMAAGIPVVASNFPLWREIVEGEGCGLTVDPRDPKAIAEAIQWLLEHPKEAEEMGKRGRRAVLEKFNWDREAEKLLDLYRKLLSR